MAWSIFKDSSRDYKDWEINTAAWFVDNDVDTNYFPNKIKFLHDGYVDVHFNNDSVTCKVVGGHWDTDTEAKLLAMVAKSYWGTYVEGFYRENGNINVIMGS